MTDRLDEIRKRLEARYEFALHPELARVDLAAAFSDIAYLLAEVERLRTENEERQKFLLERHP